MSRDACHWHRNWGYIRAWRPAVQQRRAQAAAAAQCVPEHEESARRGGSRAPPLAADPWEHVIGAGLGGLFGSAVVQWEVRRAAAVRLQFSNVFAQAKLEAECAALDAAKLAKRR